jgi:predicted nucleic acid-binding protein
MDRVVFDASVVVKILADEPGSAAALALALRQPVYDCIYLALALDEQAPLATSDARLASTAESAGITVVRVGARG